MRPHEDFAVSWTSGFPAPGGVLFRRNGFQETVLEPTSCRQEPFDRMLRRQARSSRASFAPVAPPCRPAALRRAPANARSPCAPTATARSIWWVPALCVSAWLSYLLDLPYAVLVSSLAVGQLPPAICGVLLIQALSHRYVLKKEF